MYLSLSWVLPVFHLQVQIEGHDWKASALRGIHDRNDRATKKRHDHHKTLHILSVTWWPVSHKQDGITTTKKSVSIEIINFPNQIY